MTALVRPASSTRRNTEALPQSSEACLPGAQQNVGLCQVDSLDQPDAPQGLVEGCQIAVLQLRHKIPAPVRGMQGANLRHAAELIGDAIAHLAQNFDHDDGPDIRKPGLLTRANGKGGDGSILHHAIDAGRDRRSGRAGHRGKGRNRQSSILSQGCEQVMVQIIHDKLMFQADILQNVPEK